MPLYDYRCDDCGHTFETRQGMSEPVLTACPVCPGQVKRLISKNVMVSFKGSGFYITDSQSSAAKPAAPESPSAPSTAATPSS